MPKNQTIQDRDYESHIVTGNIVRKRVSIQDSNGNDILPSGLINSAFDEIDLGYTSSNLTSVVYKLKGTTVSTLTLAYDDSNNLTSVLRS